MCCHVIFLDVILSLVTSSFRERMKMQVYLSRVSLNIISENHCTYCAAGVSHFYIVQGYQFFWRVNWGCSSL